MMSDAKFFYDEGLMQMQKNNFLQKISALNTNLEKHNFLCSIRNNDNKTYFNLLKNNLDTLLPYVYTPTIADAIINFDESYNYKNDITIKYSKDKNSVMESFLPHLFKKINLVVITDGESILGIGDQGANGIKICRGKLDVYTLCSGISPDKTLAIQLDVGTNNNLLLNDPHYKGLKINRVSGADYFEFIDLVVTEINKIFKNPFIHWEDLACNNAYKILEIYGDKICTFNDDMQGTAIITSAFIMRALNILNKNLVDQDIVIFGPGTAGTGIANQLVEILIKLGLTDIEAYNKIWLVGRNGLLTKNFTVYRPAQEKYLKSEKILKSYLLNINNEIPFFDVIKHIKPSVLIGCSTIKNSFSENIIKEVVKHSNMPIILPLSNPDTKCEIHPEDLVKWSDGKCIFATGSPFGNVEYNNNVYCVPQCNNLYAFPGIGLGVLSTKPSIFTKNMRFAACKAISEYKAKSQFTQNKIKNFILPRLDEIRDISMSIAREIEIISNEDKKIYCNLDTINKKILESIEY